MTSSSAPGGVRTFVAAEALEPYRGVKLDASGELVYADLTDTPIGITLDRAFDPGDEIAVALRTCPDTVEVRLGSDCTAGAILYNQNDGVASTSSAGSAVACFKAMTAGTNGDTVEAMQFNI